MTLTAVNFPAVLDLTGTTYPGTVGESFIIVENDGTDPIVGTFAGLPEGAALMWPGSPGLVARISYVGGTGNDVVLTLGTIDVVVTNTNDSGPGSLRSAVAGSTLGGFITFAPALGSAPTIVLASELDLTASASVTIDASGIPEGVILDGGPGANRILTVRSGTSLHLVGLSFTGGNGAGALNTGFGGAIRSNGTLQATDCAFFGNFRALQWRRDQRRRHLHALPLLRQRRGRVRRRDRDDPRDGDRLHLHRQFRRRQRRRAVPDGSHLRGQHDDAPAQHLHWKLRRVRRSALHAPRYPHAPAMHRFGQYRSDWTRWRYRCRRVRRFRGAECGAAPLHHRE
jgi:hypothetical protein